MTKSLQLLISEYLYDLTKYDEYNCLEMAQEILDIIKEAGVNDD